MYFISDSVLFICSKFGCYLIFMNLELLKVGIHLDALVLFALHSSREDECDGLLITKLRYLDQFKEFFELLAT